MKKSEKTSGANEKAVSKKTGGSAVTFPWKWVGVGAIALIIILSVILIRPSLPGGGSNNSNLPDECIQGKTLIVNFVVTLHVMVTDYRTNKVNYTHMIPNGIGTAQLNGQDCVRRIHTDYDYTPNSQPARIKVQSPDVRNFTLGNFFETWDNQTLAPDMILSYSTPQWRIVFKVNGVTIDDTDVNSPYHYENYRLYPDQNIEFYITYVA